MFPRCALYRYHPWNTRQINRNDDQHESKRYPEGHLESIRVLEAAYLAHDDPIQPIRIRRRPCDDGKMNGLATARSGRLRTARCSISAVPTGFCSNQIVDWAERARDPNLEAVTALILNPSADSGGYASDSRM